MSDRVKITIDRGIAEVRLARPDKLNALDRAMFEAVVEAAERLKTEPGVRAVVLSGEGRGFCAGLDVSSFQAPADDGENEAAAGDGIGGVMDTGDRITHLGQQACYGWMELPMPVIAAVHGACLGGGLQIALGADIRIVTPDAKLSVLEIRWGIVPDMTGTATLHRVVGNDVAKELTFTGRMLSGAEAVELGLATRVADDPRAAALELAAEIATKNPHAVRGAKRLLDLAGRVPLAEQFAAERATIGNLIGSHNQIEAVMAHLEQRDPDFVDP